jgi:hypothetical protein
MHLFGETFQKTLLVLDSDSLQGRWWKEVSKALFNGIRKRLSGV